MDDINIFKIYLKFQITINVNFYSLHRLYDKHYFKENKNHNFEQFQTLLKLLHSITNKYIIKN